MKNNKLILTIALILIITTIFYLEGKRPVVGPINPDVDIPIEETSKRIEQKSKKYERAKELVSPEGYINTDPITISELIGKKVILVDFWTFSCINCQRTFPYLKSWYEEYKDDGLEIIGVHTPEFEFEKVYGNVVKATEKYGITYPVVQDNDYQTWSAYRNRYWPRKYIIDIDGFIVYDHIGEGAYKATEAKIRELLDERNEVLGLNEELEAVKPIEAESSTSGLLTTPEVYFGYGFSRDQLGNEEGLKPEETVTYNLPSNFEKNKFYLEGEWINQHDSMEVVSDTGKVILKYSAKSVNIVAGSAEPAFLKITLDNEEPKEIEISEFDLYNIIDEDKYGTHTLQLELPKGMMAYTFTFG
tara:strand:- start:581 stop:1657 length:1077 start_codon:yes stop_codon:yes gene_type:complete